MSSDPAGIRSVAAPPPAWYRLVRLPNLLTVPGDPVAGALLAATWRNADASVAGIILVAFAAVCLYAFGLVLNDLRDLPEDRILRPERPLPAGSIGIRAAVVGTACLLSAGLVAAAFAGPVTLLVALLLACLIAFYDLVAKGHRWIGAATMGSCRAMSMVLGMSTVGAAPPAFAAAAALLCYVAAVTGLAHDESRSCSFGALSRGPLLAGTAFGGLLLVLMYGTIAIWAWLTGLALAIAGNHATWRNGTLLHTATVPPVTIQRTVGQLLRRLLVWQAVASVLAGGFAGAATAAVLIAFLPLHRLLSRRFPPT